MKFSANFTGTYLLPTSNLDEYEAMPRGECIVDVRFDRNPRFHRLAFSLMHSMFENQERFTNFEDFRRELKLLTGSYDEHVSARGETVYIPKSWDWSSMGDEEFHQIYNKLLSIAAKRYGDNFVEQFV